MASLCFWNDFELKKPPLVTIQVEDTGFAKHVFVLINRYLQQVSTSNGQEFNQTAALIGRLIARRQNSFHNMPGFRAVCKLNTALCRLLRLDLARDLEHFRSALPDVCDDQLSGEMPTRSSFEYILVRLLSFYHLHERIRECCLAAAKYFGQLLRNNNFMEFITVLLAAMAKINNLSKLQTNNCAQLYNKLLPQRSHFPVVEKHKFLNDEWKLPTQLQVIKLNKTASPREETTSSLAQASKVVTKVDKAKQKAKSDVGTVVSRKQPKTDIKESSFQVDSLTTVEDVKQFIVRESKARKQNPDSCITKAIQHHEWLSAKTIFESKLKTKEHAKALNIFRKFIGNKL
ncbi:LOW QUALITY PROTEIN: uncharacterized protein LOC132788678 [Drosophila nasuta]|uniref:LOW QUALITY PROTEIN: uncharacterized protein LOC132788678 n=1 Tax=Drosophila nasuta TaxID=42062 RepID=UPI00295F1035|nr:LOW QUALITY PROTEIN: uncharacterized protein LOC132788678 [Drosophila nasuta]